MPEDLVVGCPVRIWRLGETASGISSSACNSAIMPGRNDDHRMLGRLPESGQVRFQGRSILLIGHAGRGMRAA